MLNLPQTRWLQIQCRWFWWARMVVCCYCKRVTRRGVSWLGPVSHGVCPECLAAQEAQDRG